jgi:hypothetical protein
LTKCLNFILNTTYSYNFSFFDMMAKIKSLLLANKLSANVHVETGKYIDLNVPIGRFLSAPI